MSFFNAEDALSLWNSIKDSVRSNTARKDASGLDYTFVTPTLLTLGKLPEQRVDELLHALQGSPVVVWNLSGKALSSSTKSRLRYQVLDAPWITPGQFTQAPSLDCIFTQCYSIKSWLDLRSDHVAVVHCQNGRSRSGILIACLLKYIGAFEQASQAFDFFCSARMHPDTKPSLAPSYRILFENVDKAVDQGGYPNPFPLHLKCIAISGLPVDEVPCVEVWDMHGQVFNSHNGWKHTDKCKWTPEYGDGFFRISQDVLGDFSVMVRFGGRHALKRDKTTLIFKYQNSTAFLPAEVVELKRQNVDVNPEYADSLDVELFTVHLMFEPAMSWGTGASTPRTASLPAYHLQGRDAFECGLDEISKQHAVEPDPTKSAALLDMGFPEHYITIALQLANNSMDHAAELILGMKARAAQLDAAIVPLMQHDAPSEAEAIIAVDRDSSRTHPQPEADGMSTGDGCDVHQIQTSAELDIPICSTCSEDNILKRDQLVPCSGCHQHFHTACFGGRRIPFNLKTSKERANREKYISKYFGSWRCASCEEASSAGEIGAGDALGSESSAKTTQVIPANVASSSISERAGATLHALPIVAIRKSHADGDVLDGTMVDKIQSRIHGTSDGIAIADNTREPWSPTFSPSGNIAFRQGATMGTPGSSSIALAPAPTQASLQPLAPTNTPASPSAAKTKHDQVAMLMGLLASTGITVETLMAMGEDKQREALFAAASSQYKTAEVPAILLSHGSDHVGGTQDLPKTLIPDGEVTAVPNNSSSKSKPQSPVRQQDVQVTVISDLASENSSEISLNRAQGKERSAESQKLETVASPAPAPSDDAPIHAKYFKMVKVGLPIMSVAQKMMSEGVAASLEAALAILQTHCGVEGAQVPPPVPVPIVNSSDTVESSKSLAEPKQPVTAGAVSLREHPKYSKYFKMLKVGLPKDAVKAKMQQEGVDPAILDRDPDEIVPEESGNDSPKSVPASEHPIYSKYFRMLKVGLPKDAIKAKMQQEGVDPSVIDKNPEDLLAISLGPARIAASEHPKYSKYFKMLKVGLPKDAVKAKMQQEGVDPAILDRDPDEMVLVDEPKSVAPVATASQVKKAPQVRKKKLHWKALDASKVGRDSLWADKDDADIQLDEEEFNNLFVDSGPSLKEQTAGAAQVNTKKRINLIDMKRGQNAGIALARIKMTYAQVRERIASMADEEFTTDQLRSLEEFLPTPDECYLLRSFKGDRDMLGQAEKYMLEMLGFDSATRRVQCMIYKQQFRFRVSECKSTLTKIENACDDVKMSVRLKKVLKTILKVGNQMNDGADHLGFTLDSLLKLQSAKAFDKKTSILQYVIMLIYRNDENCLSFPDDLLHISEASRLVMESVQSELSSLRQGLDKACKIVAELRAEDSAKSLPNSTGTMSSFLVKARQTCDELDQLSVNVQSKFASVLAYFGEEPTMASHDFFHTLAKFVSEFVACRDALERQRRSEAKREEAARARGNAAQGKEQPTRRASLMAFGSSGIGGSQKLAQALKQSSGKEKPRELDSADETGETGPSVVPSGDAGIPGRGTARRASMF